MFDSIDKGDLLKIRAVAYSLVVAGGIVMALCFFKEYDMHKEESK